MAKTADEIVRKIKELIDDETLTCSYPSAIFAELCYDIVEYVKMNK